MPRFIVVAAALLAALAVDGSQIERHISREPLVPDLAESSLLRGDLPGEIIIELDAEPTFGRAFRGSSVATSELDVLFERLEKDLQAIDLDVSRTASKRGETVRSTIHHRYSMTFAGVSATVDPDAVDSIRALSYVRKVHPDRHVRALLHESVEQVGAPAVWASHQNRGAGVVVAIIDSGIDYHHPALGGGIGAGYKVIGGRDFVNNDDDPMDDAGHGTHVAGIVAANSDKLLGVAPDASLLALKVLDQTGSGRDSWVLAGIEEAVSKGAQVVNMSLGRPAVPDDPVIRSIERAFDGGIVFCVAAGNSGRFLDIGSPGRAPNAITVGAIDRQGKLASFSSKGPVVPTASIKPEISAPGVSIVSSVPGGGFAAYSGTSMASPHVAGVVALVRSIHPGWSARRVRTAVIDAAAKIDEEVMAGGAGAVYAPDAVVADLFASPSELSFGIVPDGPGPLKRSLYLTNRSDTAHTYTLEIEGERDGIELDSSGAEIAVAPGEARLVNLELSIDPDVIESPRQGSLSFGGLIRVTGGSGSVSIPWAVTKAATFRLRWSGTGDAIARLGTDSMMTQALLTGEDPVTDLMIGAGSAILWIDAKSSTASHQVFVEDLEPAAISELTLGPEDAPYRLEFRGRDVQGRLLSDRGALSLGDLVVLHPSLSGSLFDLITFVDPAREVFVSGASERLEIRAFERAFDPEQRTSWTVSYQPVKGIEADVHLVIETGDWIELPLRLAIPDNLIDPATRVFSSIWITRGTETVASKAAPIDDMEQVPSTEFVAWLAPSQADAGAASVVEISGSFEEGAGSLSERLAIKAELSAIEEGIVPGRRSTPRLSDHISPSGQPVTIGSMPAFPSSFTGAIGEVMMSSMLWIGPNHELRLSDSPHTEARLYASDGAVIATPEPSPVMGQFAISATLPEAGTYVLETSTDSFVLAGEPVEATLSSTFDTRNEDSFPPTLTSLRISDAAGQTNTAFSRGSTAMLTFSAVDFALSGFSRPAAGTTKVEYRRHAPAGSAESEWRVLTAVEAGDDLAGHGPISQPDGVLYRVDLSEVTETVTGPADLRISLEDAEGNSVVYKIEPAILVTGDRRRLTSRR